MKVPNSPLQAYLMGKRHGCQETFDVISMALLDKCGWHTFAESPDDRQSVEYLFRATEDTAEAINKGYLTRKDIKKVLKDEARIRFVDDGVK